MYHLYYASKEYIYALLLVTCAKMTGNFNVFLTISHLIIIGCVYVGAFRLKRHANPVFILLLFYLIYYNHSLNIIRQYMAMSVIFLAVSDLLEHKYKRYIIAVIVAIMLHNSAFLGFLPLILYELLYPQGRLKTVPLKNRLFLYVLIVAAVFFVRPFTRLLINSGLLSRKFLYYVDTEGFNNYTTARILSIIELIAILTFLRSYRDYEDKADFFLVSTFAFTILYQLASSLPYGKRIPAYFSFLNLVSLGLLAKCQKHAFNTRFIYGTSVVIALAYWCIMYAYLNVSRTIPYVFGF